MWVLRRRIDQAYADANGARRTCARCRRSGSAHRAAGRPSRRPTAPWLSPPQAARRRSGSRNRDRPAVMSSVSPSASASASPLPRLVNGSTATRRSLGATFASLPDAVVRAVPMVPDSQARRSASQLGDAGPARSGCDRPATSPGSAPPAARRRLGHVAAHVGERARPIPQDRRHQRAATSSR